MNMKNIKLVFPCSVKQSNKDDSWWTLSFTLKCNKDSAYSISVILNKILMKLFE